MREFMNLSKALADANRVRIVLALRGRELCGCQLTELFGLAPSTMSKHLAILYQARLVNHAEEWPLGVLFPAGPGGARGGAGGAPVGKRSLGADAQARADARRLKQVLRMAPTEICKRQCRK